MKHEFATNTETEGVWHQPDEGEFCRWWWNEGTRTLRVRRGEKTRELTLPAMEHRVDRGIQIDLPETAKDLAMQIERLS